MSDESEAPANNAPQRKAMPVGKPFQPGQSGNPDGAPKWLRGVRESLKSLTPLARKTLRNVMRNGADKDKVAAAKTVLEYTVPKPKQTHRVIGDGKDPLVALTPEQLVALLKGDKT